MEFSILLLLKVQPSICQSPQKSQVIKYVCKLLYRILPEWDSKCVKYKYEFICAVK